jgi:hypothetical protein
MRPPILTPAEKKAREEAPPELTEMHVGPGIELLGTGPALVPVDRISDGPIRQLGPAPSARQLLALRREILAQAGATLPL